VVTIYGFMGNYGYGMMGNGGMFFGLLFWILIIVGAYLLIKWFVEQNKTRGGGAPRKLIYASIIDAQNVLCYRKDGGRSPGFALQDVSSNHHKLLWSKTTVVSVMGKGEAVTSSGAC